MSLLVLGLFLFIYDQTKILPSYPYCYHLKQELFENMYKIFYFPSIITLYRL